MTDKRSNSLLTKAQRKFLKSDGTGYGSSQRYDFKKAIKKRIPAGIRDAGIVWENWGEWDEGAPQEAFDENISDPDFEEGLVGMLALIYSGVGESKFENLLNRGIRKASQEGHWVNVEFEVNTVENFLLDDVIRRYESEPEEMADGELAQMALILRDQMGDDAVSEVAEAWEEKQSRAGFDE